MTKIICLLTCGLFLVMVQPAAAQPGPDAGPVPVQPLMQELHQIDPAFGRPQG